MTTRSKVPATLIAGLLTVGALTACSTGTQTPSASSPSTKPSAASSSTAAGGATGSPSDAPSSTHDDQAIKEGASAPTIIKLAHRVGCKDTKVRLAQNARKSGANAGINCEVKPDQYIFLSVPNRDFQKVVKVFTGDVQKRWYYVAGDGWMAVSVAANSKTAPTVSDAKRLQSQIGGSIRSSRG